MIDCALGVGNSSFPEESMWTSVSISKLKMRRGASRAQLIGSSFAEHLKFSYLSSIVRAHETTGKRVYKRQTELVLACRESISGLH